MKLGQQDNLPFGKVPYNHLKVSSHHKFRKSTYHPIGKENVDPNLLFPCDYVAKNQNTNWQPSRTSTQTTRMGREKSMLSDSSLGSNPKCSNLMYQTIRKESATKQASTQSNPNMKEKAITWSPSRTSNRATGLKYVR